MAKKVIIPLPDRDFDTTEVSIPWKHFVEEGLQVTFSTETGKMGQTDPRLLTGVIFGQLGAKPDAIAAYRNLEKNEAFRHPSHTQVQIPRSMICCSCPVAMPKACASI